MLLSKFNLIFLVFFSSSAFSFFSEKECLDSSFNVMVSHSNKLTFGLSKTLLTIDKSKCEITISHEKLKFMKNKWMIDVCREPVHIKSGVQGVEVLKKRGSCSSKKNKSDFCSAYRKITESIQDDGLIFAPGEKENLSTDHGRVYCTYQLLKGYLNKGLIFSRYAPAPKKNIAPVSSGGVQGSPAVEPIEPSDSRSSENSEEGTF